MEVMEIKQIYDIDTMEFKYYWGGDDHWGGEDFDKKSWKRYHDRAVNKGAMIFKIGDQIGSIVPGDPRYTADTLKASLKEVDDISNAVVAEQTELWKPYADHIGGMGIGNHEASFLKYHKTNVTKFIIDKLNTIRSKHLPPIKYLGYCGFVRVTYEHKSGGNRRPFIMAYHHGAGGNAPVTEGIIGAKRMIEQVENVDALFIGHTHRSWSIRSPNRIYLSQAGKIIKKSMRMISVGSHQEPLKQPGNDNLKWTEEKAYFASAFGGAILTNTLYWEDSKCEIETEVTN